MRRARKTQRAAHSVPDSSTALRSGRNDKTDADVIAQAPMLPYSGRAQRV